MIASLDGLPQLVAFTFILSFFAMAAAAAFFLIERDRVAVEFRQSVTLAAMVCGIAAINYLYMKDIYLDGAKQGADTFPTEFRYIDWLLTVPLMLVKFPSLLGLGARGRQVMGTLVSLAVFMIVTGYIGETHPDQTAWHLGFWGAGCVAGAIIMVVLGLAMRELPESMHKETRRTITMMSTLVLIGWLVYPVGYLAPSFGLDADVRELVYNVADVVNKVGLGMVVYFGGRRLLKAQEEDGSAANPAPESESPYQPLAWAPQGR
jgi:sensory rhodopsin